MNFCKRFILLLVGFTGILNGFTQVKSDSSNIKFTLKNEAQFNYQLNHGTCGSIRMDHVSDYWGNRVSPRTEVVSDNPLFHGAFYALIKSKTSYKNKYDLELDILLEHRGMSYGVYDMENVVILPIYNFSFNEKLKLLNSELKVSFQLGNFLNNKVHQGLKIYNLDTQGSDLILSWKKLFLKYHQIGDLSRYIGLNLEETYDLSVGFSANKEPNKGLTIGLNLSKNNFVLTFKDTLIFEPYEINKNVFGNPTYLNYGIWGDYKFSDNNNLYFQYEIKGAPYINVQENSALLVGGEFNVNLSKFLLSINPEFRYYGWMYNFGHRNDSISYRNNLYNVNSNAHMGYTVGRYLYPLMNYNNKFSQWAVYTDYQYQNIAGIELRAQIIRQLYKELDIQIEAESCTLIKEYEFEDKKTFTYLFYSAQLTYDFDGFFNLGIGFSNKAMNLDKHYQAFYMRKKPIAHFFLRKNIL